MKKLSKDFAAPVKLWALLCVIVSTFFIADYRINGILSLIGLLYLAVQCKWRLLISFGFFYVSRYNHFKKHVLKRERRKLFNVSNIGIYYLCRLRLKPNCLTKIIRQ